MRTCLRPPRARDRWSCRCPGRRGGPRIESSAMRADHERLHVLDQDDLREAGGQVADHQLGRHEEPAAQPREVVGDRDGAGGRWQPLPGRAGAPGDGQQVTEHRARGGRPAGARAPERDPAHRVTHHLDEVEHAIGRAEGGRGAHRHGAHGRPQRPVPVALGAGHELDGQAQSGGATQLGVGDAGDARRAVAPGARRGSPERCRVGPLAEAEPGEQRQLVRGVVTLHVGPRVGLRVAACLGLGQDVRIGPRVACHGAQDVVGGAIDDAPDGMDGVRRRGPSESGPRMGMPPATAASNRSAIPACRAAASSAGPSVARSALLPVTTCLPARDGGTHQVAGVGRAADELDHDIDVRVGHDSRPGHRSRGPSPAASARAGDRGRGHRRHAARARRCRAPSTAARHSASISFAATGRATLPRPSRATRSGGRGGTGGCITHDRTKARRYAAGSR